MLSVSYAGKNGYSAGKTSGVLRGGAFGGNRGYVLAHCAPPHTHKLMSILHFDKNFGYTADLFSQ